MIPWALIDSASSLRDSLEKRLRGWRGLGTTLLISTFTMVRPPVKTEPGGIKALKPLPSPLLLLLELAIV
jgi:hypothetical protein